MKAFNIGAIEKLVDKLSTLKYFRGFVEIHAWWTIRRKYLWIRYTIRQERLHFSLFLPVNLISIFFVTLLFPFLYDTPCVYVIYTSQDFKITEELSNIKPEQVGRASFDKGRDWLLVFRNKNKKPQCVFTRKLIAISHSSPIPYVFIKWLAFTHSSLFGKSVLSPESTVLTILIKNYPL